MLSRTIRIAAVAAWLPAAATGGGDDCASAVALPAGALACTGDIYERALGMTAATPSATAPGTCWEDGTVDGDTWYKWTNDTGQVAWFGASTDLLPNWYADSQIAIYTDCPATVPIACNESQQPGNELALAGLAAIAPGETAYIQFDGYAGDRSFDLAWFLCWPCQLEPPFTAAVTSQPLYAVKLDARDVLFAPRFGPSVAVYSVELNEDPRILPTTRIAVSISTSMTATDELLDSSRTVTYYQARQASPAECR